MIMSFLTFTFISDTTYQRDNNHAVSTDIGILLTRPSSGSLTGCIEQSFIRTEKRKNIKIAGVYGNSIHKFPKLLLHRKES